LIGFFLELIVTKITRKLKIFNKFIIFILNNFFGRICKKMLLALVLLLVATLALYNCWWKRRKLPPGPVPFPLFGNMLEVAREPPGYEAFRRWRAKYGPVYTVRNFRKKK
jgi:hypothetical protein